jgi:hypothetical protein
MGTEFSRKGNSSSSVDLGLADLVDKVGLQTGLYGPHAPEGTPFVYYLFYVHFLFNFLFVLVLTFFICFILVFFTLVFIFKIYNDNTRVSTYLI